MSQDLRLVSLLLGPYVVAAVSLLGPLVGEAGGGQDRAAAVSRQAGLYDQCREQARGVASEVTRAQRARQFHDDPQARSQRPTWLALEHARTEDCLRNESAGRWAQRPAASRPSAL